MKTRNYFGNLTYGVTLLMVVLFTACSSDETFEFPSQTNEVDNYTFIYKGNIYEYKQIEGDIICSDETKEIINELQADKSLVTFVHENGDIEYFNENELKEYLESIVPANQITSNSRATDKDRFYSTLNVYDGKDNRGTSKQYEAIGLNSNLTIGTWSLSWGISSFKLTLVNVLPPLIPQTGVRFCSETALRGYSLYYTTDKSITKNFADIPLYAGSSEKWDNHVKSFKFGCGVQ